MKICNQFFVKDIHRDRQFAGTVKCACCSEESNLQAKFPFELKLMTNFLNDFVRLHKNKGCNKTIVKSPTWASGEVSFGIVV